MCQRDSSVTAWPGCSQTAAGNHRALGVGRPGLPLLCVMSVVCERLLRSSSSTTTGIQWAFGV